MSPLCTLPISKHHVHYAKAFAFRPCRARVGVSVCSFWTCIVDAIP